MTDLTVATSPTPPKITRLASSNIRVMFNYGFNPTNYQANTQYDWSKVKPGESYPEPDAKGNYAWVRCNEQQVYLDSLGLRTSMMVTTADENRAFRYHDGTQFLTLTPALNRWDSSGAEANNADPLNPLAARAVCALAKDATHFGVQKNAHQPVILDIEGTQTYNHANDTEADLLSSVTAWRDRFRVYRNELGQDFSLFSYFYRGFAYSPLCTGEIAAIDQEAMSLLSGYNIGAYSTDKIKADPGSWFDLIDKELGYIKMHYPQHAQSIWATACAEWQLGGVSAGPVPLDFWKEQIDHLNNKGVNVYVWATASPVKEVKPLYDWLAKYSAGVN